MSRGITKGKETFEPNTFNWTCQGVYQLFLEVSLCHLMVTKRLKMDKNSFISKETRDLRVYKQGPEGPSKVFFGPSVITYIECLFFLLFILGVNFLCNPFSNTKTQQTG